jgi:orotidine-5'-phosphate decarboxylase
MPEGSPVNFADRLAEAVRRVGNPVVVGLDPVPSQFPPFIRDGHRPELPGRAAATVNFGMDLIDVVAPLVPALKLQAAYYEALGPEGMRALYVTAKHARDRGLIVIIDGKRNDIGPTASAYARAYLGEAQNEPPWPTDALTINPYLGGDGINPFLSAAQETGRGLFVLVRTSNPSAGDFQDLVCDGRPLYEHVAQRLAGWSEPFMGSCGYSAAGAVVGATYPEQLKVLRELMPRVWFLVPGYGAQGGKAADIAPAFDEQGLGGLVNNSRGLIYAHQRPEFAGLDWREAVARVVREMVDDLAAHTSSAALRTRPV